MKFIHISLNATTKLYQEQRMAIEKAFWLDHHFPQKPGADEPDGPEKKRLYSDAKIKLQLEWAHVLENWTCQRIREALDAAGYDPKNNDCLYAVSLPEGYWTDIEPDGRIHSEKDGKPISHYANPFYRSTLEALLSETSGCNTLAGLSSENLAIFAGTMWWKDQDTVMDMVYNTALVFHCHKCCFLWDKQLLTSQDGLGNLQEQSAKLRKWLDVRNAAFAKIGLAAAGTLKEINSNALKYIETVKSGFCSPVTQLRNPRKLPYFDLELPVSGPSAKTIPVSIDICADFLNSVSQKLLPTQKPVLQFIPAMDAAFRNAASYYASRYHCICDGHGFSGTLPAITDPDMLKKGVDNLSKPLGSTMFLCTPPLPLMD